jgi:hypothetical protein
VALSKGTNSYVTVEEANAYFVDRLDAAAWTDASAEQKAQSLVTATSQLDQLKWLGSVPDEAQPLAFPRNGEYLDPRLGFIVSFKTPTPDRIIKATFELAYHLLNNDGLLDETGRVLTLEVAGIALTDIRATPKLPSVVRSLISCMLIGGGSKQVWRAN